MYYTVHISSSDVNYVLGVGLPARCTGWRLNSPDKPHQHQTERRQAPTSQHRHPVTVLQIYYSVQFTNVLQCTVESHVSVTVLQIHS